ncbi:MAG: hypothetical protein GYB68_20105 [Chloroflexi bacterium]|nr:hypothetical protein [Chloroflexota bacterium]
MRANPILARQIPLKTSDPLPGWLSIVLLIAIGLSAPIFGALGASSIRLTAIQSVFFLTPLMNLLIIAGLLPSLIYGAVGAFITSGRAHDDLLELVRLTPVTRQQVVWAYVISALYRMRWVLAFQIGLLLVPLLGWLEYSGILANPTPRLGPSVALTMTGILVGGITMSLLALVAGVVLTLRWRNTPLIMMVTTITMAIILMAAVFVMLGGTRLTVENRLAHAISVLLFALGPLLLAVELVDAAPLRAWHDQD